MPDRQRFMPRPSPKPAPSRTTFEPPDVVSSQPDMPEHPGAPNIPSNTALLDFVTGGNISIRDFEPDEKEVLDVLGLRATN